MNKAEFIIDGNKLTVLRTFDAPIDAVWAAWTQQELLDQWWAPAPWTSETKRMDFSNGGSRLYAMVGPDGERHWCLTEYRDIVEPSEFSGSDVFCDENGTPNPNMPTSYFTNTFEDADGKTHVTILSEYGSAEEVQTVMQMGLKEGLTATLDQLEKQLAQ